MWTNRVYNLLYTDLLTDLRLTTSHVVCSLSHRSSYHRCRQPRRRRRHCRLWTFCRRICHALYRAPVYTFSPPVSLRFPSRVYLPLHLSAVALYTLSPASNPSSDDARTRTIFPIPTRLLFLIASPLLPHALSLFTLRIHGPT